jgi:hypothetical protein
MALARFTKSRGSETLTTSYCRRVAAMSLALHVDGRLLLTIFYKSVAVNIVDLSNSITIPPNVLARADRVIK